MLARLRARGALPGFRGVRAADPTVRRPQLSGLTLRVASGIVAVPLLLSIAYLGNPLYGIFIAAATAYAATELRSMLRQGGYSPIDWLLIGLAAALPLSAWLSGFWSSTATAAGALSGTLPALDPVLVLTVAVIVSLASLVVRPTERALVDWSVSLSMALYLGGFMLFYLPLRAQPSIFPGFWVAALLVLSWVSDSSAFFFGRAYGRTRLAPAISPNKSVEGAVAGLVAPAVVGLVVGALLGISPLMMGGYGLVIAVGTVVGDLIESLVKRQTGVKDSGVLIPGHGGLLDRMDSLLLCAPLAVLYLRALSAVGGVGA
ncbi:MAG TPA: phosphatidate cytidylyltransferase [Chloroflexota bacterium]